MERGDHPISTTSSSWQQSLETLVVSCILGSRGRAGRYAIPSAGSIYPYGLKVTRRLKGEVTFVDFVTTLTLVSFIDTLRREHLDERDIDLLFRPSLSMRKYGHRGFLYGLQDCVKH